jgi:hypothetical protein
MVLRHAMELDVVVQDVEEAAAAAGLAQGEISAMLMPMALREGMVVALEMGEWLAVKTVRGDRQRGAVGRASLTVEAAVVVAMLMGRLGMSLGVHAGHMSATAALAVAMR